MLRNERQARRLTHPHLTYSTTGTLVCLVCHIQLKSENTWNKHLISDQHAMRLQRIRENTLGRPPGAPPPQESQTGHHSEQTNGSKKRKADDSSDDDSRKKSKPVAEHYFEDEEAYNAQFHLSESDEEQKKPAVGDSEQPTSDKTNYPEDVNQQSKPPDSAGDDRIDEDEWAAFERDVATPPSEPSALTAEATIIAAPVSAAELAAQSREEASLQRRSLREAEMEGEKEDAARQLEDEFDEMAGLEERVKRLKEKREKLRAVKVDKGTRNESENPIIHFGGQAIYGKDDQDDTDDEIDEWEMWRR